MEKNERSSTYISYPEDYCLALFKLVHPLKSGHLNVIEHNDNKTMHQDIYTHFGWEQSFQISFSYFFNAVFDS